MRARAERDNEAEKDLFDHCRHIPTMRWFGKQLVAVCRKAWHGVKSRLAGS